jgi:hypothetical protein
MVRSQIRTEKGNLRFKNMATVPKTLPYSEIVWGEHVFALA